MAVGDPIILVVLGPMRSGPDATVVAETRTRQLVALVYSISQEILNQLGTELPVRIWGPDENPSTDITEGVLRNIEQADLVICDLTGGSPNVMYELGLVHALGIPYIIVTSDAELPFYLRPMQAIKRLDLSEAYDPGRPSHIEMIRRIRRFLDLARGAIAEGDEATLEDFARNAVSNFFGGLPIVDISAPTGLAAGYWQNALRRFVSHSGYFEPPFRKVMLNAAREAAPSGAAGDELPIGHFVAVKPIDGLNGNYQNDMLRLGSGLNALGLRIVEGSIAAARPQDLRVFGAKFLARDGEPGEMVMTMLGAVVIEIPTTLYALQFSPRIMRIDASLGVGARPQVVETLRRRRYRDMLTRFERVMRYYLRHEPNPGHMDQVHFVALEDLPPLLTRIGALPAAA